MCSLSVLISTDECVGFADVEWGALDAVLSQGNFVNLSRVNLAYLFTPTWTIEEQPETLLAQKFPILTSRGILDTRISAFPFEM